MDCTQISGITFVRYFIEGENEEVTNKVNQLFLAYPMNSHYAPKLERYVITCEGGRPDKHYVVFTRLRRLSDTPVWGNLDRRIDDAYDQHISEQS